MCFLISQCFRGGSWLKQADLKWSEAPLWVVNCSHMNLIPHLYDDAIDFWIHVKLPDIQDYMIFTVANIQDYDVQDYMIFTVAVSNLHYKIVFSFPSASEGECDSNKLTFNDLRHLCCWLVVNCWYMNLILALIFMIIYVLISLLQCQTCTSYKGLRLVTTYLQSTHAHTG